MGLRRLWNRLRGLVERESDDYSAVDAKRKAEGRARRARFGIGPVLSSREAARLLGERSELLPEMKRDLYKQVREGVVTVIRRDGTEWRP